MLIIHGDHTTQIRQYLKQKVEQAQKKKFQVTRLDAKNLQLKNLEEALGSSDLFGQQKLIVIEGIHSLPTSKRKKSLIEMVSTHQGQTIILLENKTLTKTQLKKFPQAEIKEFKISPSIWKFLDSLGTKSQKQTLEFFEKSIQENDEFMVMSMLARQVRLLIQSKENHPIKGAPFMINKLKKQSQSFTLEKLLMIHAKLLEIDLKTKTSTSSLSPKQQLDLLLISL
jgi:DNA polymerase III delta subunit